MNFLLIFFCKTTSLISKLFNLGNGSTWPGHIALIINKNFIADILKNSKIKIVLIAGTNGKTTTGKIITTILQENRKTVFQNTSGANLLNGIASSFIANTNFFGKLHKEYAVFEIDENALPLVLRELKPHAVILLNLFRDQLDRYGEIDTIVKKWQKSLQQIPQTTKIYLNADDPKIAYLGKGLQNDIFYFGLEEKTEQKVLQHAADSIYCPNCQTKLTYKKIYYSHLGEWHCKKCKLTRPNITLSSFYYPLSGTYNQYNTLAAVLFAQQEDISDQKIEYAMKTIKPAFGRQEVLEIDGKKVQLFLSKNPTSFNQSLATIFSDKQKKTVLFVLNDRIPDGRDISWIWDIDFELYMDTFEHILISGDRVYDMALRLQYTNKSKNQELRIKSSNNSKIFENLEESIQYGLNLIGSNETLYILPTYSAMLEVRKILTGKKIL